MLLHSGPLGLVHCLLYVELLPFGCISSEDCELMQLKQSQKVVHVHRRLPVVTWPFTPAHKTRLCISWKMQSHWNCASLDRRFLRSLYVLATASLWAFWASWSISWVCTISTLQDSWSFLVVAPLGPTGFWRFSKVLASLSTTLASFLHCMLSPFWLMRPTIAMTCTRYSLVFPWEKMEMLKTVPSGSLILRLYSASLVVTRSIGGTHGMSSWLLSCPHLHSKSFSPLGFLRTVWSNPLEEDRVSLLRLKTF